MRVWAAVAGLLMLSACTTPPADPNKPDKGLAAPEQATSFVSSGGPYDYRYAYRIPGAKLKAVLQGHADGCDKLGPTHCKIVAMRYRVDDQNHIQAVLTFNIDPAIARAYGEAATKTVTGNDGALVDTEVSGSGGSAAMRPGTLTARLREQLASAQDLAAKTIDPVARKAAADRAVRIQSAIATIADVDAESGQSQATAPVLMTYESSSVLGGLGTPDANFHSAGDTLIASLASLAQVLAGVGPWLILMILIVAILRWVVQHTGAYQDERSPPVAVPSEIRRENFLQRWFNRDEDEHAA